jgi:hypothetical protein
MDRFLKTSNLKKQSQDFASADVICVWGPEGIGKTWLAENTGGVHLTEDTLRSKQATLDFMARMRTSDQAVIIDDFEAVKDLVGIRELKGSPSRSQMFITSRVPVKLAFPVLNHEFPIPSTEKIIKIINFLKPVADEKLLRKLAEDAKGSVRYVLQELEFRSDARDFFQEPRQALEVLFCKGAAGELPNMSAIHEHGFMWAVVQENYPDGNISLADIAEIAEVMTDVDIIDERMYREQSWNLLPYFAASAIFKPAHIVKKSLKKLRPGSMWTKFQNECMKRKKVEALRRRYGIDPQYLPFYAQILTEADPQDISFMKKISTFCK